MNTNTTQNKTKIKTEDDKRISTLSRRKLVARQERNLDRLRHSGAYPIIFHRGIR